MTQIQEQRTATALAEMDLDASTPAATPPSLARLLFSGSSALGFATLMERGFGFLANVAAARLGGAHIFGAYSVAMTTANSIASYAGAGIGTTANRFSGEYPYGQEGYRGLLRTLGVVSLGSASLAVAILWFAAAPIANYLIRNPGLAGLLRFAALSAGAIILLECLRGLLIGQRRFKALLTLSALFGVGLVIGLPLAAGHGPSRMVLSQAAIALSAVLICIGLSGKLEFAPPRGSSTKKSGPRPFAVMRFGMVQLAGMIGLNAAGWWVASLVARSDTSLAQSGWYSAASQLRNMCAVPAWLIAQTAYAQLTDQGGRHYGGPGRVTVLSTIVATAISLAVAGPAAALMPWIMPHLYGKDFAAAELAATLAVATALIHMSAAPAANRLTVVSLRLTGVINAIFSVVLVGLGTWLIPKGGAAEATAGFLFAHLFSALAVLVGLFFLDAGSRQLAFSTMPAVAGSLLLAGFGWMRFSATNKIPYGLAMLATTAVLLFITFLVGRQLSTALRELTIAKVVSAVRKRASFKQVLPQ